MRATIVDTLTSHQGSFDINLDLIVESPTNPRRTHNTARDAELAESVATLGVLQPVLVRPAVDGFELVFGHRRLRAARKAGLVSIPAFVRELSDLEVLEAQIVENTQREDVPPLEEARAYKRLHVDYHRSVEEIAEKVGKSRGHVYGRLKLLELCAKGQKAVEAGELEATVGLLIARIPNEKLQLEALERVKGWRDDEPLSYRGAVEVIHREFMLRLKDAPFKADDAQLLPIAGPCTTCPKRTGNQAELFGDVKSADICTDPTCYQQKVDASWKRRAAEARQAGQQVLEGKAAEKARRSGEYVSLDEHCWEDGKQRTYGKILGKDAPPSILVRAEYDARAVELVRKTDVKKILREKGVTTRRDESARTGRTPAHEIKREIQLRTARAAIEQVISRAGDLAGGDGWWVFLATAAVHAAWHDTLKLITARRGWTPDKKKHESHGEAIERNLVGASVEICREVAIEILVSRGSLSYDGYGESLTTAAETLGIKLSALELEQKTALEAARKEKKDKAKVRAKKKSAKTVKASKRAPATKVSSEATA